MQISVAETDTGIESTDCRVEIFILWRSINRHPQTGKPPFLIPQLLTSSLARLFKSYLTRNKRVDAYRG
jgi:hypothetical protein